MLHLKRLRRLHAEIPAAVNRGLDKALVIAKGYAWKPQREGIRRPLASFPRGHLA